MFWLLTALLFGPDPSQVAVGYKMFPTEQACLDNIAELRAAPLPDGVVAAEAACTAHSNPVTQKEAVTP